MKSIVCPYCFEKIKPSEVEFRCTNYGGGCGESEDKKQTAFWGYVVKDNAVTTPSFSASNLFGKSPESVKCAECGVPTRLKICPCCHSALPKEMAENGNFIISIIGARSSGKTNYITTLINELKYKGHFLDISIYPVGDHTTKRYKDDFFDQLYDKKKVHAPTDVNDARAKVPLIYKLVHNKKSVSGYLVFYDTAGENFEEPRNIPQNAKFLKNSDAFIFLLDTFSIKKVHNLLSSRIQLSKIEQTYDNILGNILEYFDNNDRSLYKKPLALTFSKIDVILNNRDLFHRDMLTDMRLEVESEYFDNMGYSANYIESVNYGLKGALEIWGEEGFFRGLEAPNHFGGRERYFGVSALGEMPLNNNLNDIKPYRVLDPLIWILDQLKFPIKKKK